LQEAGLKVAIAGARSTLAGFAPVVEDEEMGRGPLAGICAALAQTDADLAVFLPVDMVVMPSSLVRLLLDTAKQSGAAITLAAVNGRVETFPVVICRKTLGVLKRELAAGRGGCLRAFEAVAAAEGSAVHFVEVAGAPGPSSWFLNLNTRQDVERAEELSASDPV
jgi:molybdopterin-guanine dinucleotide biosynthesis protein A